MFFPPRRTWLPAAAAVLLLAAPRAVAAPPAGVRDEAKFFKPETVKEADRVIDAIRRDHAKDLLVETLPAIPDDKKAAYEKAKDNKEERARFFAEWARERARAAKVNGVYVLITRQPGHVQAEVGNRTEEKAFTRKDRDRLVEILLAPFKHKDFDKGLLDGVAFVRKAMDDNLKTGDKPGAAPAR